MADMQQQRARNSWLRISTIVGYIMLLVAMKVTGQMAGYSNDTTAHLIDHVLARSLVLAIGSAIVWGLIGQSIVARWSRWGMDKSHVGVFALAALLGGVGMMTMARHGSPDIQGFCFDGVAWMLGWSMGLEYVFVAQRGQDAGHPSLIQQASVSPPNDSTNPRHTP